MRTPFRELKERFDSRMRRTRSDFEFGERGKDDIEKQLGQKTYWSLPMQANGKKTEKWGS